MSLRRSLHIQLNAIRALTMRELHTRFGDHYLGYLWLLGEPALLAIGVSAIHAFEGKALPWGMRVAPFTISGYTAYCLFRYSNTRSNGAIHSNRTLLFHRYITVFDILCARAVLETLACFGAAAVLLFLTWLVGLGNLPDRPMLFIIGWFYCGWFCFSMSILCCTWSTVWEPAERLIHPLTYFSLPISCAFNLMSDLPPPVRPYVALFPQAQVSEILREGQFYNYYSPNVSYTYMTAACLFLSVFSIVALRSIRNKIEL